MEHQKVLASGYYGQYGQDLFLESFLKFLPKKDHYTYIDIGAYDGLTLSNSRFLDSNNNWGGVCIEANPSVYLQLVQNRRKPKCMNLAVSDSDGKANFMSNVGYSEMLSGLQSKFDTRHQKRIEFDNKHFGGDSSLISVETRRFDTLMDELNITDVDLLMIDIEGGEPAVLSGINFTKVNVSIILVERNYSSKKILRFLRKMGFRRVLQLGSDDLYINEALLN
jgi:FkbM family methyltransferase